MDGNEGPLPPNYLDILKTAANAFYLSISQHGPYDVADWKLLVPIEVTCFWPEGEIWNNENKCLYICDSAALNRLQTIKSKLLISDSGVAWPHVNLSSQAPVVEWLMVRENFNESAAFPRAKEWFVISRDVQDLMDYVVKQHCLVAARTNVTVIHPLSSSQSNVSLTSIIIDPGDIFTSISQSPYLEENGAFSSDSPSVHVTCLAGTSRLQSSSVSSDVIFNNSELDYHTITNHIPQVLHSLISRLCQCRISDGSTQCATLLHSEVTIKEELPISHEFFCAASESQRSGTSSILPKRKLQRNMSTLIPRGCELHEDTCTSRTFHEVQCMDISETLLQCPKCTATFEYGLQGKGLCMLLGHIHVHHKRLSSYCTSVLKKKYSDLFKNSAQGTGKSRNDVK